MVKKRMSTRFTMIPGEGEDIPDIPAMPSIPAALMAGGKGGLQGPTGPTGSTLDVSAFRDPAFDPEKCELPPPVVSKHQYPNIRQSCQLYWPMPVTKRSKTTRNDFKISETGRRLTYKKTFLSTVPNSSLSRRKSISLKAKCGLFDHY